MPIQKKHHIHHKLLVLAEGDTDFKNELTRLYQSSFQELKDKVRDILHRGEIREFASVNHKYRASFLMFDLKELAAEMDKGKQLLEAGCMDIPHLNQIADKIQDYCSHILYELGECK